MDPWFTEGIYDGSWWHYPKVPNPIANIGDVDLIYVSHVHPDHYDGSFLKSYFEVHGAKKIIIADHQPNHLLAKIRADGIPSSMVLKEKLVVGRTTIELVPHKTGSISDIDSAIVVKYLAEEKTHCVVNANDLIFDDALRKKLKDIAGDVDILLCGYTGAGPYPQNYFDISDPQLPLEADKKKRAFFERYRALTSYIGARVNIPFAGKYILGGKLAELNPYRGVADAVEVLEFDKNAVVLADEGGEINTSSFAPTAIRTATYDPKDLEARIGEISECKMSYERLIAKEEIHQLPLKRLLVAASRNAVAKSECDGDYFFCFNLPGDEYAVVNANKSAGNPVVFTHSRDSFLLPRSEITLDPRYLFGLLTNVYHWNNAEVGSHKKIKRYPNILNRQAESFLNYLSL